MVRLILLVIFLMVSLLTIFRAPTYHLWLLAVLITEFPFVIFFITSVLLVLGFWVPKYQLAGTFTGLAALVMVSLPVIQSYRKSSVIQEEMNLALGRIDSNKPVISLKRMIFGAERGELVAQVFTYSKKNLKLDFYPSVSQGKSPCLVVVHGGSWKSGDNKQLAELNFLLAARGYHVAAINYGLAPLYQSPSQLDDVRAALSFLKSRSEALKIDTSSFVLLGRSAGAQIALLAAYTLNNEGIKGVINFYGPADMVWGYSAPSSPLVMDSRKVMEDYLGGTYKSVPERYHESSPLNFVSENSVPTLIIHGENDALVAYEHSVRLRNRLVGNGVRNYFLSLPWATHGFDYNINGPGGQLAAYAVFQFLNSTFKSKYANGN